MNSLECQSQSHCFPFIAVGLHLDTGIGSQCGLDTEIWIGGSGKSQWREADKSLCKQIVHKHKHKHIVQSRDCCTTKWNGRPTPCQGRASVALPKPTVAGSTTELLSVQLSVQMFPYHSFTVLSAKCTAVQWSWLCTGVTMPLQPKHYV